MMMQSTALRGCSSCVTRRVQAVQQQSISTLVKSPHKPQQQSQRLTSGRMGTMRGRSRDATSRSSAPYNNNNSSNHSRRTPLATRRRNATLASNGKSYHATKLQSTAQHSNNNPGRDFPKWLSDVLGHPRTVPVPRWVSPRHYSITLSECFGHASFILVAISYSVDDFLMLRIIAVAGSTSMLFFTYFHPHGRVLWLPFKWNLLFIAINSYRIGKIFWDRYLAEQISQELHQTRDKFFPLMDPVEFAKLARLGTVETFTKGVVVIEQDQPNKYVRVVLSGGLRVERDEQLTYKLEEGMFVSESGLHAGLMLPDSIESCCRIVAESDARLLTWERTELVDMLHRSPQLRRALKAVLSWDIVRKLKAQRIMLFNGLVQDAEEWTHRRHEQTEHRYKAILKNVLTHDEVNMNERKKELIKYRTIHHIDDEHHRDALKECGWTVEEYEQGYRHDDPPVKKGRQPDWYVRQLIMRIVG
ncbi:cNMP [Seminavis robusta]|uniref:CNMP n=1 Tax=Seminavis robusta TaxID=568900 RepID=A0A9N8EHT0_9STRA|nr:cNMP [Seminavis robusta]|eukprot:Sro1101_g241360.1 cNMP (473) ;mRNA; r:3495-4913